MLRKFYEQVLDVELYCQMVDLIFRLSEEPQKKKLYEMLEQKALFLRKPDQELEDVYGLRYPGEVLERLGEKMTVTERQIRALGLALAVTAKVQNDGMFIGRQKPSFWKRMKDTLKKSDLYWLGIQYLMEDNRQRELYEKLLAFPVESIEEMLFLLSVLPDDRSVWDSLKGKLNLLLGKERKFTVYTHTEVYVWLITHYHGRIEGYRKKDIETLKYVMRLPFSYAKDGSTARKKLMDAGYTVQEIMFLSMSLLYKVHVYGLLKKDGLTAEKMAVETCLLFLEGDGEYLDAAQDLCKQILESYRYFAVRLENTSGIFDRLYCILKVENVRTYQLLLSCDGNSERHERWFEIDLTDSKWHALYSMIDRIYFDRWVRNTLAKKKYTKDELKYYLSVYQDLTGESFYSQFWKPAQYEFHLIFRKFAELELVHPIQLLEECLAECQADERRAYKKWKHMAEYLKSFMEGMQTMEAVEMLFKIEKASKKNPVNKLFSLEKLLWDNFGIEWSYNWGRQKKLSFSRLDLIRPFLSLDNHRELFSMIEEDIFKYYPDMYDAFLVRILSVKDNFLWFPKDEARNLFLMLSETDDAVKGSEHLRKIYLTGEEKHALEEEEKRRKERRQMAAQLRMVRKVRKDFTRQIAIIQNSVDQFTQLDDYVRDWVDQEERNERRYITKRYLCSIPLKNQQMCIGRKETKKLCRLVMLLFDEAELTFSEMKKILNCIELSEEAA